MSSPTIAAVLAEFLAEQERRLAPKSFAQYREVVELLQHCLNGYTYAHLNELEAKRFEQRHTAAGDTPREFCDMFGPEHILPNVGQFLSYFLVRKVSAGQTLLQAAGTVTKKLATWLAARGYAGYPADEVATLIANHAEETRELRKASALADRLEAFADTQDWDETSEPIDGYFQITRVEPGKIWLEGLDGRERGPIALPVALSRQCPTGWTISGSIGRAGRRWRLVDVWHVDPL